MSIIHMTGWESGNAGEWELVYGTIQAASGYGLTGNYCLAANNSKFVLPSAMSEMYVHFRFYRSGDNPFFCLRDYNGTNLIQFQTIPGTHFINALVGGSVVATSTSNPILGNVVYSIQIYIKIADSGGRIWVKVDGHDCGIDYTGDTKIGSEICSFLFASEGFYDDFVVKDDDWPGNNLKVQSPSLTDNNSVQWDYSAVDNHECIDERPVSDTDYNYTNVVNEVDTFLMNSLSGSVYSIKAVKVMLRCGYEGNPTPTHIRPVVNVGGTDYPSGSDLDVPLSFGYVSAIWETNPQDSQPWESADIDSLAPGYKSIA